MRKLLLSIFLIFIFDYVYSKKLFYNSISLLQSKLKTIRNETFFTSIGDQLFKINETSVMIPANWTSYTQDDVMYFHPAEFTTSKGIISIRRFEIPNNLANRSEWYTNTIEEITNSTIDKNIHIPMESFNIDDFEGNRYIFRRLINETIYEGYVAVMVKNNFMYVIYGMYDMRLQSVFRTGVETAIASLTQGQAPTGLTTPNLKDLYGCWEYYDTIKDFLGNHEIFRTLNFTKDNEYSLETYHFTSIFGDPKMSVRYLQNGYFTAEGNLIMLKDPNKNINIVSFKRIDDSMLLNDKLYTSCS